MTRGRAISGVALVAALAACDGGNGGGGGPDLGGCPVPDTTLVGACTFPDGSCVEWRGGGLELAELQTNCETADPTDPGADIGTWRTGVGCLQVAQLNGGCVIPAAVSDRAVAVVYDPTAASPAAFAVTCLDDLGGCWFEF